MRLLKRRAKHQPGLCISLVRDRTTAYRDALRHSRAVTRLRTIVPVTAAVLIAGLAGALIFLRPGAVSVAGVEVAGLSLDGNRLVMANPRLEGVADGNRRYTVEARRAIQDGPTATRIDLERLSATIELPDDTTGSLEALAGTFDRDANRLMLTQDSVFRRSDGLTAYFENADIAIDDGELVAPAPVRIEHSGLSIVADRARIEDAGKRLVFEEQVRVTLDPSALPAAANDPEG